MYENHSRPLLKEGGLIMSPKKWMLGLAISVLTVALSLGAAMGSNAGDDAHQEPKGTGLENLPVIQHVSKPVKQGDLEFQIVADAIWPMPARTGKRAPESGLPTGESPVRFQMRVTNHNKKEVRFLSGAGTLILQSDDGKELKVDPVAGRLRRLNYVTLEPGKTITINGSARIQTGGPSGTCLWRDDEFGTSWLIDGLKPGKYSLRLRYNSKWGAELHSAVGESGAWLGDVRTTEVPIEIVDLKASLPAVFSGLEAKSRDDGTWEVKKLPEGGWKGDVEVMALADSIWQAPAPGKQMQLSLGFRMTTVEKWTVRIIPSIASVSIKSTDGEELPVRKTAATVSVQEPQLLALRQVYSESVATPATLFRAGKTLTLAWADGAGHVWHVENLKPGRYTVQYVIRADKGEPSPYISYWVGELRTATVMVEIKE
jgi:hypothetical protein